MRKFLISVALVSTALAAAPAMAQGYGQRGPAQTYGRDGGFNGGGSRQAVFELSRDLDRIDARIARSVERGTLSRREAFGLRRDVQQVRFQLRRSGRDGIGGRELRQLRVQVAQLEQRLRYERNDRDGRRF